MKYELINKYQIKQIKKICHSKEINGVVQDNIITSNPSDDLLDSLNIGYYLDTIINPPTYDSTTHYLKTIYYILENKLIRDYELV
jgi:hypothetical protein